MRLSSVYSNKKEMKYGMHIIRHGQMKLNAVAKHLTVEKQN